MALPVSYTHLDSTKKMINADAIAMMKPTAIVLNFARDLLVDEEAMVDALARCV